MWGGGGIIFTKDRVSSHGVNILYHVGTCSRQCLGSASVAKLPPEVCWKLRNGESPGPQTHYP